MTTYSLYKNNKKINGIFYNNQTVACVYKGNDLIYDKFLPGEVIFESSTPGIHTISLPVKGTYKILVVGAGGGAVAATEGKAKYVTSRGRVAGGGSGGKVEATFFFNSGTFEVEIGSGGSGLIHHWEDYNQHKGGDGSVTRFDRYITCNGGKGGMVVWWSDTYAGGAGGTTNAVGYQTLNSKVNGNSGQAGPGPHANGGSSVYNGYGAGGAAENWENYSGYANDGKNGYVKVIFVERYKRIDYDNNQIVYESSTPGDFSTVITTAGRYKFTLIGGGGGGAAVAAGSAGHNASSTGSSAGGLIGYYDLFEDRNVTITGTIGKGGNGVSGMDTNLTAQNGGTSTFSIDSELAGTATNGLGGHAWWRSSWEQKNGGDATGTNVIFSKEFFGGENSKGGNGTGLYQVNPPIEDYPYGCGGSAQSNGNKYSKANKGTNGYINITFVKRYYVTGLVLFESNTPGTHKLVIQNNVRVRIDAVGGGGGYNETAYPYSGTWITHRAGGGSGGYIYGYRNVPEGVYDIIIGAGAEGATDGFATEVFGEVAGGGHTGWFYANGYFVEEHGGAGGEVDDISSSMTGVPGNPGTTGGTAATTGAASVYLGTTHGRGACKAYTANPGYVKIVVA